MGFLFMSDTKQKLEELREKKETLLMEREAELLEAEVRGLDLASRQVYLEGSTSPFYGQRVPLSDYPENDWPSGMLSPSSINPYARLDDRKDGKWRPIYENEIQLNRMRGKARILGGFATVALGAMDSLANYVIGNGYEFKVEEQEDLDVNVSDKLISEVQRIVDRFLEDNDFLGELDIELHNRSREDGEAYLRLEPAGNGRTDACIIEPEQVTEPAHTRQLEDFLGISSTFVSSWSFGIHTRKKKPHRPLGYHVIFDGVGKDWDYINAKELVRFKRNTGRSAKRGISDYLPIENDLEREAKLRRNTAEGAAIQAAIAFIREHAEGVSEESISSMINANTMTTINRPKQHTTNDVKVEQFRPGTVKDMPNGMKYHAGPLGTLRSPVFIEVAKYLLRSIGLRWTMPEYMISGDASNANYSSTLVAGTPFVRARKRDQEFYIKKFTEIIHKAIRNAINAGVLERFGIVALPQLLRLVRLNVIAPEVENRDASEVTNSLVAQRGASLVSQRTAIAELGRNPDEELAHLEDEVPVTPADEMGEQEPILGSPELQQAIEAVGTEREARAIIEEYLK